MWLKYQELSSASEKEGTKGLCSNIYPVDQAMNVEAIVFCSAAFKNL